MNKMQLQILFVCSFFLSASVLASNGIGGMATNMMGSVNLVSDFVYSACVVIGGSFLFAAIIKYFEHRRSPLMVPISTVVFLVIAGILLLLLPLLSWIYSEAVPYSFLG